MSRNVWRRLFAYGVLEATDGSPSEADGFSWTEAALALFVLGAAGTILSLLTQRALPWDLPCEPLFIYDWRELFSYMGTPAQQLALVGKILTVLWASAFFYVVWHLIPEIVIVAEQESWWTRGYLVRSDEETVHDVVRLVYQAHGQEVVNDLAAWIQDVNAGRMMLDGTILDRQVFLRRGWRLIVPAPPEPSPGPYTGQFLNATLIGSAAAFLICMGWYLVHQPHA
jgi:hypothetical protein